MKGLSGFSESAVGRCSLNNFLFRAASTLGRDADVSMLKQQVDAQSGGISDLWYGWWSHGRVTLPVSCPCMITAQDKVKPWRSKLGYWCAFSLLYFKIYWTIIYVLHRKQENIYVKKYDFSPKMQKKGDTLWRSYNHLQFFSFSFFTFKRFQVIPAELYFMVSL